MKPQELVQALRAMGLTQKQIQKRTGIPQPTISKIGRGGDRDVMLRTYLALVAAYQQHMSEQEVPADASAPPAAGGRVPMKPRAQARRPDAPPVPAPPVAQVREGIHDKAQASPFAGFPGWCLPGPCVSPRD